MPDKNQEEESGFKVVDRRLFTPEGERRGDAEPEPPKQTKGPEGKAETREGAAKVEAPPPPPQTAAEPPPRPGDAPFPGDRAPAEPHGPAGFEQLVMSLATTAMYQLGLVKSHEEDTPRIDLPAAKDTIDLLDILRQKTQGNLSEEEAGLLEGSLYELRMVFVELSKAGRGR